jgi:hypothetical protein
MSIKKYLPSKKFSIIIGSVVLLCVIIFVLIPFLFKNKTQQAQNIEIETLSFEDLLTLDSDGDGLYDWEEVLWGMDPFNPDTTGNGILDGQEVSARRRELQAQSSGQESGSLTYTDALAQQMFMFVAGNPNAQRQDINAFAESLTSDAFRLEFFSYLNNSDINVSSSVTVENYYTSVVNVISRLAFVDNDLALMEAYMVFEGAEEHKQALIEQINTYKDILESFLAVSVYEEAVKLHLNIANSLVQVITILEITLFNVFGDPVIALSALGQYDSVSDTFISNMNALTQFFRQKGLVYN